MLPLEIAYEKMSKDNVTFYNPTRTQELKQWVVRFVDNNTLMAKINDRAFQLDAAHKLIEMAKSNLEIW